MIYLTSTRPPSLTGKHRHVKVPTLLGLKWKQNKACISLWGEHLHLECWMCWQQSVQPVYRREKSGMMFQLTKTKQQVTCLNGVPFSRALTSQKHKSGKCLPVESAVSQSNQHTVNILGFSKDTTLHTVKMQPKLGDGSYWQWEAETGFSLQLHPPGSVNGLAMCWQWFILVVPFVHGLCRWLERLDLIDYVGPFAHFTDD